MYDELVKRLRAVADGGREEKCDGCPYEEDYPCCVDCLDKMHKEAADAIEELQKCLDGVEADNDSLCATIAELERDLKRSKEYEAFWEKEANEALKKFQTTVASIPRWIPVTERLPEEYVNVLCYYEYYRYGEYNCMFRTIDRGYYGNGIWGGEAGQGHKNKVLAWMPLPSTEGLDEA